MQASNFSKYAKEARAKSQWNLARRIEVEGKICRKLVCHALAHGYAVSVNDGEEWVVKKSTSLSEVMNALFTTDMDYIRFYAISANHTAVEKRIGQVTLIYGNDGNDVMSDWSAPDLDAFSTWLKPVTDYAETI